ncbi:discoidin domain-containing protein, partial [Blautia wexlerae]|nr:discoidin domain-containing protein [Blautia wexlerae]
TGEFYTYSIRALDAADNESELSKTVTVQVADAPVLLPKDGWAADASDMPSSATPAQDSPGCAIDNNVGSRWTSGTGQYKGMWFMVNLGKPQTFSRIVLNCQSSGDYIHGYEVVVSNDGETWSEPVTSGKGYPSESMEINFPAQTAQFVKIISTENVPSNWWSINELYLYNQAEVQQPDRHLTVTFTARLAALEAEGDTGLANLTGVYKAALKAGEAFTLVFTPRVEGREFLSAQLNGKDVSDAIGFNEETNESAFTYEGEMAKADKELNFAFTTVNKQVLRTVISIAEDLRNGDEYGAAIPTVRKAFDKALENAQSVEADRKADQKAIDNAWSKMLKAIHFLSFAEGDTTELEHLLAVIEMLDPADYTSDSWAALQTAVDTAKELIADGEPLQADVEKAYDALQKAWNALVRAADKNLLQEVVNTALAIDLNEYLDEGKEAFSEALTHAQAVLEDQDATAAEVNAALSALNNAMQELRKIPTKDALKDVLNMYNTLDLSKYTDTSVAALKASVNLANGVLDDPDATGEEIAQAIDLVTNAYNGLQLKPENKPSRGSGSRTPSYGNLYGAQGIAVVNAAQGVVQQAFVRSDTTVDFALRRGSAYCFKMTVVNGNGQVPSFTVGNGSVLKTQFVAKVGNDCYYRVYAVGAS